MSDDKPVQDAYKTLCETCTEDDEEPKQIGPLRPDTNFGRVRANIDRQKHRHSGAETVMVKARARTVAGYVLDEVTADD